MEHWIAQLGIALLAGLVGLLGLGRLRDRRALAELASVHARLGRLFEERSDELVRSERKYRSLVGQASAGILVWEPASRQVLEANARAAELLGARPRDLVGSPLDPLFPGGADDPALRALCGVVELGAVRVEAVELLRCPDAGRVPFFAEISASLVRLADGEVVLGILTDLTERRELEQRAALSRERAQRSERMASIGALAAGIAHEINNPMGYVASNLNRVAELSKQLDEWVRASESGGPLAEIAQDLGEIATDTGEGVRRVTEIVRALREFSHGRGASGPQWVDLPNLVGNCLTLVHGEFERRGVAVKLETERLPAVRCSPMQIAQVVVNLLRNAALAVEPGGHIVVSTLPAGDRVHVAVEDDGAGIAPEHLSQLFDPFFTTRAVGDGTGLGLAVSAEIARAHEGEIWVDSRPGVGSRFVLELPVGV